MVKYGFFKILDGDFSEIVKKLENKLSEKGFGILTRINVAEKMREKLGKKMGKYLILGACDPAAAFSAIAAEPEIGLLLPCNAIIFENSDGKITVATIAPSVAMNFVKNPKIAPIAETIEKKLESAIAEL